VFLVPKETDAALKSKAKFIKLLSNGLILIVHSQKPEEKEQQITVWTMHKLSTQLEFSIAG
jgi:hypothetical protein